MKSSRRERINTGRSNRAAQNVLGSSRLAKSTPRLGGVGEAAASARGEIHLETPKVKVHHESGAEHVGPTCAVSVGSSARFVAAAFSLGEFMTARRRSSSERS